MAKGKEQLEERIIGYCPRNRHVVRVSPDEKSVFCEKCKKSYERKDILYPKRDIFD